MSQELTANRAFAETDGVESRPISVGSDNVCSVGQSESDSESESDSLTAGRVRCASCGSSFFPDKNRRKFCDHSCYSDWRSKRASFVDRFWSKVNKTETCWLWTGATRRGYGFIAQRRVDGRQVRAMAHRVAWEFVNGPIPDGLVACHRCDTPACVNVAHLFLGSQKDNIADALQKRRLIGRSGQVLKACPQPMAAQVEQALRAFDVTNQARQLVERA